MGRVTEFSLVSERGVWEAWTTLWSAVGVRRVDPAVVICTER